MSLGDKVGLILTRTSVFVKRGVKIYGRKGNVLKVGPGEVHFQHMNPLTHGVKFSLERDWVGLRMGVKI